MTSQSLRRVLAGSLILTFLSLGGPAAGEASDFFAMSGAPSFWERAWQWLAAQIPPVEEEGAAPVAPTAGSEKGDAGWTLDPNG